MNGNLPPGCGTADIPGWDELPACTLCRGKGAVALDGVYETHCPRCNGTGNEPEREPDPDAKFDSMEDVE